MKGGARVKSKRWVSYPQTLNVLQEDVADSLIVSFNVRVGATLPGTRLNLVSLAVTLVDVRTELGLLPSLLHVTGTDGY